MHTRRVFAIAAWIAALVFLLSCQQKTDGSGGMATDSAADTSEIGFRITWTDYSGRGQAIQKIVDVYNARSQQDAFIRLIGGDEDSANIQSVLLSDPETILVLPYRHVQFFGGEAA